MTVSNLPFNVFPRKMCMMRRVYGSTGTSSTELVMSPGVWLDRDVINRLGMSPVPIGGEPFRQGREHGHSRFWPLLQDGV